MLNVPRTLRHWQLELGTNYWTSCTPAEYNLLPDYYTKVTSKHKLLPIHFKCFEASNQLYDESMQLTDIIIMFIYHNSKTEHKLQKLNRVHKSIEGYQRSYSSLC